MQVSRATVQREMLDKSKSSLKNWITIFFIVFFISLFGIYISTTVMQMNRVTRYISEHLAIPTVERALEYIDGDSFERLSLTLNPYDSYYLDTQQKLHELKEETSARYIYTMVPKSEFSYQYIIDGSDMIDGPEFSYLGEVEDVSSYEDAFFATLRDKAIQIGKIEASERWGALISAYAPIYNSAGEAVGLVGCDFDGAAIASFARRQALLQFGVVGIFTLIGLLVYIVLIRGVNRLTVNAEQ